VLHAQKGVLRCNISPAPSQATVMQLQKACMQMLNNVMNVHKWTP